MKRRIVPAVIAGALLALAASCHRSPGETSQAGEITLQLNWVAEPEFGGFYAAKELGLFKKRGLEVNVRAGGPSSNVIQLVESGTVDVGVVSADEIVIARSKGADLAGVFAVYQHSPNGVMTHAANGFKSLAEVFSRPVTLAAEPGLPYVQYLRHRFGEDRVKVVPYTYNIQPFIEDPNLVQQCFITSEPILARRQGVNPVVFPIGDSGFDPYTTVVVVRRDYLEKHRESVRGLVEAIREGWRSYLADPRPVNDVMGRLNTNMDAQTFEEAAAAQKPLIETAETRAKGLGAMTAERWKTLIDQLAEIHVIDRRPDAAACFVELSSP